SETVEGQPPPPEVGHENNACNGEAYRCDIPRRKAGAHAKPRHDDECGPDAYGRQAAERATKIIRCGRAFRCKNGHGWNWSPVLSVPCCSDPAAASSRQPPAENAVAPPDFREHGDATAVSMYRGRFVAR